MDKIAFVAASLFLALLWGYASGAFGVFPGSLIDVAVRQAFIAFSEPHYLAPPQRLPAGVRALDGEVSKDDVTLVSTHQAEWDWKAGVKLIDREGRILHYWIADPEEIFPAVRRVRGMPAGGSRAVHGTYLFPNGDLLVVLEYVGIARLDACGRILWSRQNGAHHSIARNDDGTFWIPLSGPAEIPTSAEYPEGFPGLTWPVNHEHLAQMTPEGETLRRVSVLDILFENDMMRYLVKARTVVKTDVTHLNDIEPLSESLASEYPLFEPGDLLLSLRASDLIMVVDPITRVVRWFTSDRLVQQHDPDFLGMGWIGVLSNNWDPRGDGSLLGGSEVLRFQPHTDSVETIFPTPNADAFYTPYLGKWQMLEDGGLLLTEGRRGRLLEVDANGRTRWDWVQAYYDDGRSVEITEGTRHDISMDVISAWQCSPGGMENSGE